MSKNGRQTPRKPATKFTHLQKKMQKQQAQMQYDAAWMCSFKSNASCCYGILAGRSIVS